MTTELNTSAPSTGTFDGLVSIETLQIFQWIFFSVINQVIVVFGIVANIINIVCFVKQGFKDSVNISFLGLAISDLLCLIPLVWVNICLNPAFLKLDLPIQPTEFQYMTASWPHVMFTRVTIWITAFITFERCICITMPLKVKAILTHKRVITIIFCIFIVQIIGVSPVYFVSRLLPKYYPARNRTLIGLVYLIDKDTVDKMSCTVSNMFIPFSAFCIIVVSTIVLVVQLRIKSKWRQSSTNQQKAETVSGRDEKITKMVISISTVFIICFIPVCLIAIGVLVQPGLSVGGRYGNLFIAVCSIGFALESTNSSMNIFIYYHMSTKYKTIFCQLFRLKHSPVSENSVTSTSNHKC